MSAVSNSLRLWAPLLALSVGLAAAAVWNPAAAAGISAGLAGAVIARRYPNPFDAAFIRAMLCLLAGYALLGRTFAHLGVWPVYPGEAVLVLGSMSLIASGAPRDLLRAPFTIVLVAFMTWGLARTLPYIGEYGANALRDGVIWGYAGFALLVAPRLLKGQRLVRVPEFYDRLLPWLVVVAPVWNAISEAFEAGNEVAGTGLVANRKPSDVLVHLGGAAAFLLIGLRRSDRTSPGRRPLVPTWAIWLCLLGGLLFVGAINRGGFLAAMVAVMVVLAARPPGLPRRVLRVATLALVLGTLWLAADVSLEPREGRRTTPRQLVTNLLSVVGIGDAPELSQTREWRILWWERIVDYTVFGEYFWTGKGFGVHLAYDDGIEPADSPSRSPHNGHITILARAGVPGAVLWVLLQSTFAVGLLRSYLRARRAGQAHAGQAHQANLRLWVLAYWAAFMVASTFEVFLEGPQGGIWFWCLVAYGLALLYSDTHQPAVKRAAPQRQPWRLAPSRP